jgi:hypothetical protein
MLQLVIKIWKSKDLATLALLLAILLTAGWTLSLPFSETVQESTLKRFHLASPNFATWAIQQPVPSMYNFDNRYWSSPQYLNENDLQAAELGSGPIELVSQDDSKPLIGVETDAINHFPARTITFAFSRINLSNHPHRHIYLRSRYRGKEIKSSFRTTPVTDSEIRLERLESSID